VTKLMAGLSLILIWVVTLIAPVAQAQTDERRVALVIGNAAD
jgi:hypothetical protein